MSMWILVEFLSSSRWPFSHTYVIALIRFNGLSPKMRRRHEVKRGTFWGEFKGVIGYDPVSLYGSMKFSRKTKTKKTDIENEVTPMLPSYRPL